MNGPNERKTRIPLRHVICARVRDLHIASGESIKDLVDALLVVRGTVCDWFAFRCSPRTENIENIATHYGIPVRCIHCRDEDAVCPDCNPQRRPPRVTPYPPPA